MQASAEKACETLKILSHPHRLLLLCALKSGEKSVNQLAETVEISQSSISQHLARLRHQKVVTARREGQTVYYSMKEGTASLLIEPLNKIFSLNTD